MPDDKKYPMTNQLQYIKKHIFMTVTFVRIQIFISILAMESQIRLAVSKTGRPCRAQSSRLLYNHQEADGHVDSQEETLRWQIRVCQAMHRRLRPYV